MVVVLLLLLLVVVVVIVVWFYFDFFLLDLCNLVLDWLVTIHWISSFTLLKIYCFCDFVLLLLHNKKTCLVHCLARNPSHQYISAFPSLSMSAWQLNSGFHVYISNSLLAVLFS